MMLAPEESTGQCLLTVQQLCSLLHADLPQNAALLHPEYLPKHCPNMQTRKSGQVWRANEGEHLIDVAGNEAFI